MLVLSLLVYGISIFSVCLHEFGHTLAAYAGGDTSVKEKGYLSLNPLNYLHPFTSLLFPSVLILFGGIALPGGAVSINMDALRSLFWKSLTAAAEPMASTLVALLLVLIFHLGILTQNQESPLVATLAFTIALQVSSVVLNLLPLPPLDGFRIIAPWLGLDAEEFEYSFRRWQWFVLSLILCASALESLGNFTYEISARLGIPRESIGLGYEQFRANGFIIAIAALLLIFASMMRRPKKLSKPLGLARGEG